MPRAPRSPVTNCTECEDAFCREYVGNKGNGAAAYRSSYSEGCSPATAAHEARRLLRKPHIRTRIDALKDRAAQRCDVTRESLTVEYFEALRLAKAQEDPGNMCRVLSDMAKLHGLVGEDSRVGGGSIVEVLREVGKLLHQERFAAPAVLAIEHEPA